MAGGSALNRFPLTSFLSQYKNATAKSSFLCVFQFPPPKLSSTSSPSYSIRTHFHSNSFRKTFHVRRLQQNFPIFLQKDSRFDNGLKQGIRGHSSNPTDNLIVNAGYGKKSASSNGSKSDGRVVPYNVNAIPNEEGGTTGVNVSVGWSDGEYVLKIKRSDIPSSTDNEDAAKTLQDAGMLFLQAQIVREMGEKLLAQYRASLPSII